MSKRIENSHDNLPVVRLESLGNILSESNVRVSVDRDLVVVVDSDKVAELEVTVLASGSKSAYSKNWIARSETHPAREAASEETPSIKQPSPVNM